MPFVLGLALGLVLGLIVSAALVRIYIRRILLDVDPATRATVLRAARTTHRQSAR